LIGGLTIEARNADPVNTLPRQGNVYDGIPASLGELSVSDVDSDEVTTTLDVRLNGFLAADGPAAITRADNNTITLSGTIDDVNASLATATFTVSTNGIASGPVRMTTVDAQGGRDEDVTGIEGSGMPSIPSFGPDRTYTEGDGAVRIDPELDGRFDSGSSSSDLSTGVITVTLDGGTRPDERFGLDAPAGATVSDGLNADSFVSASNNPVAVVRGARRARRAKTWSSSCVTGSGPGQAGMPRPRCSRP
jgi:hypothetical protein